MIVTLTPEAVSALMSDVLFRDNEPQDKAVLVDGITRKFGFHPERIAARKAEIIELLNELPSQFHEKMGGGWSFMKACVDRHGTQWTGMQLRVEELFCLGMAVHRVVCLVPRDLWPALPGGMPYYMVTEEP